MPQTHTRPAQRKAFSSSGKHTLSIFHPVFQTLSSSSLRPRKHPQSYGQTSQKPFLAVTCGIWFAFQSRAINPEMHDVKRAVNGHSWPKAKTSKETQGAGFGCGLISPQNNCLSWSIHL